MVEIATIYIIIFLLLTTIQTIVGVGVLVLGTPVMLLMGHSLPVSIETLLPISILTSFINILYFKIYNKKNFLNLKDDTKKFFFYLCIPSIFIGTFLLKNFHKLINFKIVVALVILLTLIVKLFSKNNIIIFSKMKKKFFLMIIGLIHGLTNSGGTLLTIFLLSLNKNLKKDTRQEITFFYLFLASFQFLIFLIFFEINISINLLINYIGIVFLGVILGNIIEKKVGKSQFTILIDVLALISAIFLIIL